MEGFYTKVVGITYDGREAIIEDLCSRGLLKTGTVLQLVHQRNNIHDANAVAVMYSNKQLGFLSRDVAAQIAPKIDAGKTCTASVVAITGSLGQHYGINIKVMVGGATKYLPTEKTTKDIRNSGGDITISREDNYAAYLDKYPILKRSEQIMGELKKVYKEYSQHINSGIAEIIENCKLLIYIVLVGSFSLGIVSFAEAHKTISFFSWGIFILLSCFLYMRHKKEKKLKKALSEIEKEYEELLKVPKFDKNYNYRDDCKIVEEYAPHNKIEQKSHYSYHVCNDDYNDDHKICYQPRDYYMKGFHYDDDGNWEPDDQ